MLYQILYPIVKVVLGILFRFPLFAAIRIEGGARVPRRGGLLIVANHLSIADPLVLWYALPRVSWFMGGAYLFEIPLLGAFLRFAKTFPVRQRTADRAALHRAEQLLLAGEAVVIFPEGECSENGQLMPFLPGVALLVRRTRVPVLPVGLIGTNRLVPYGKILPRPAFCRVRVRFGEPLRFDDTIGLKHSTEMILQRLLEAVAALASQPVPTRTEEASDATD